MKKQTILTFLIVLTIIALSGCSAITGTVPASANSLAKSAQVAELPQPASLPAGNPASDESVAALEGSLEQIYEQVNPSVVNIRVVQKIELSGADPSQFFGFPFFSAPQGQEQQPQEQYQTALGSGFVWDSQGHIVTNNHVVADADKIEVTFSDGKVAPAELIGADPDSDLAVLKVDLPVEVLPVQLADSTTLKVGQLAIAIGNPFGLDGTMTVGIISALGRSLPATEGTGPSYTIPDIIQTDAPINPGNSGGVLVNDAGQVVGVTSAIESPVRANAGIGFAIPSAIVDKVVPALISDGAYQHTYLGISGTSLVPDLATAMDLPYEQRGVLVGDVLPNSPAAKAGLQGSDQQVEIDGQQAHVGGDVITAINGTALREMDDLIAYLAGQTTVGQEVSLTILRVGKERTISITLVARPSIEASTTASQDSTSGVYLGILGVDVNDEIVSAMNLPKGTQGVLIQQVQPNSGAAKAELRGSYIPVTISGQQVLVGGDIITAVDTQPVSGIQELHTLISQKESGQTVTLSILRDGKLLDVDVVLGK